MAFRFLLSALLLVLAVICSGISARGLPYDVDALPMSDYRMEPYGMFAPAVGAGVNGPHKRVPSAGDMMVRFGKRSA
ncbi:unnamed protein product [Auanema sp. JU1783]|nr:unnamed protein product [Auanema sp. JU1783]